MACGWDVRLPERKNDQFGEDELDEHGEEMMQMCVCVNYDDDGGFISQGGYGNKMPKLGDPPVVSCYLLLRFLDDALNMLRSLQHLTIGLMSKLDDLKYTFPFDDLYEKLRWHANCYWEWQEAETSKFLESQQGVVDSAKALCYFFIQFSRMHTEGAGIFPTKVPPSGRKFFLGGNWKCNGTQESIKKLVDELNAAEFEEEVDIVVCPPFLYIDQVLESLTTRIDVAAQNCWTGKGGAYTGEISADQLADVGVKWVVAGHAERRHGLGETNSMVARKVAYALAQGLGVIIAVGETFYEREANMTKEVVFEQLQSLASKIADWTKVVLAYEPVWAIGTGKACSPEQAQEVHLAMREWLSKNTSEDVASTTRIIYGASVSSATCNDLAKQPDIDGFFVGGAAWNANEFAAIANSVKAKKNIDFCVEQMESLGEEPESVWEELLDAFLKFRAIAMKRFSTSLFEQEIIDNYRANVDAQLETATKMNIEAEAQLKAERAQREVEYNEYLDAELEIVRDGETSTLQAQLLEKRMEEEFKALEEQEFKIFNDEYSVLMTENADLAENLLDAQNYGRTYELQQRGKNGQSAEEVADLMWVFEHDTVEKTRELAEIKENNDALGAELNKMILFFVMKDREERKRRKWLPWYAASRIQRYWKRFNMARNGGVDPYAKGKKGGKGKGKKGKK